MKKSTKIIISSIIIILIIALSIMTYLYLDMRKVAENNLKALLDSAESNWKIRSELTDKVNELEEKLANSNSNIETDNQNNNQVNIQYGDTFYATIKSIGQNQEQKTVVRVSGLDINDINTRDDFYFTIRDTTDIIWRHEKIDVEDLKVGQNVAITFNGNVQETSPAGLTNVIRIKLLDDEK